MCSLSPTESLYHPTLSIMAPTSERYECDVIQNESSPLRNERNYDGSLSASKNHSIFFKLLFLTIAIAIATVGYVEYCLGQHTSTFTQPIALLPDRNTLFTSPMDVDRDTEQSKVCSDGRSCHSSCVPAQYTTCMSCEHDSECGDGTYCSEKHCTKYVHDKCSTYPNAPKCAPGKTCKIFYAGYSWGSRCAE